MNNLDIVFALITTPNHRFSRLDTTAAFPAATSLSLPAALIYLNLNLKSSMPGCAVYGTLQRESLADFGKIVPDFKKVFPGLVTKHTAFVNRKCDGNFLCVHN
jgi:hypothetical protein